LTGDPGAAQTLSAGRVGRPHGLDGSFYVTGARARLLELGATVTVAGRRATVQRRAGTDERPIVRLEGVGDREGARALRGLELRVQAAQAPSLGEGEWWEHELQGCEVRDGEELLGRVARLIELPSCEALEVRRADAPDALLVPMVKDAIREVDTLAKVIQVNLAFLDVPARKERS
jgi:16S rRNA processing protein RimM